MATLLPSLRDPDRGLIPISASGLRIGRDPRNDLVLDSSNVSRRHAFVVPVQGQLAIHDEHSTNGTFVNNDRVRGTVVLHPGDAIRIGSYTLTVETQPSLSIAPQATRRRHRRLPPRPVNVVYVVVGIVAAVCVGVVVRSVLPEPADRFVLPTPVAVLSPATPRTLPTSVPTGSVASAPGWADVFEQMAPNVVVVANQAANASGTGFFIDQSHAVTNAHVVQGATNVEVTVLAPSGASQPITQTARVLARDTNMDLAVLTLGDPVGGHVSVGSAKGLRVGDEVMAVGEPHGLAWTATFGRVSALRTGSEFDLAPSLTVLQFDAAINPGNSGGPLVARDGNVVGLVTLSTHNAQGLSFALAGDALWSRARDWIAHEATGR